MSAKHFIHNFYITFPQFIPSFIHKKVATIECYLLAYSYSSSSCKLLNHSSSASILSILTSSLSCNFDINCDKGLLCKPPNSFLVSDFKYSFSFINIV